jgi:predicted ArsR family transcriptional regulator
VKFSQADVEAASAGALGTRRRILARILEAEEATAAELAELFGLTQAGVRRQLAILVEQGFIAESAGLPECERKVGRPARAFRITAAGRATFAQGYDQLAIELVDYLKDTGGPQAIVNFARHRLGHVADRYALLAGDGARMEPVDALARALDDDGYVVTVVPSRSGYQLCQHHCPYPVVAQKFPQFCETETSVFAELLGTHVQRLATIAHGDRVCTTHIPRRESVAPMNTMNSKESL